MTSSPATILEAFGAHVTQRGGKLALWSRGEGLELSFADLAHRADERADRLAGLDLPGPLAVATGNRAAFCELFLACRRLEIPFVACDGAAALPDKVALCRRLGVSHLAVREGEEAPDLRLDRRPLGGGVELLALPGVTPCRPPAGTALVKLTSGSTGDPVGVCLGEDALLAGIGHIARGMGITAADRVLVAIPLSHSYGFDNGVLSLAVVGTPLVLEPRFFPTPLLSALAEGEVTFFPTVPPLVRTLAESAWPAQLDLRTVICAGGRLDPEAACRFRERSQRYVHQFYGSTETGGITYEPDPAHPEAPGTVGQPLPGVTVELGPDGRVTVRSPANHGGVLGQDAALGPTVVTMGDLGEWTPTGRLRLVGRTSEFFNVGGRRVSAMAVEAALRATGGVADVAVVGVEDPVRGDRLVAFVVAEGGFPSSCRLPAGLAPRDVRLVQGLPYTERGKLDRQALARRARGGA